MKGKLSLVPFFITILVALIPVSCDDDETYADKLKREKKQIEAFLQNGAAVTDADAGGYLLYAPGGIRTISETEFERKGCTTDVAANEYVLFNNTGLYMQIVDKGSGEKLKEGESNNVIVRYTEYSLATAAILSCNRLTAYEMQPDLMHVENNSGTISANFLSGLMLSTYGTSAVPAGWLTPLKYVNLGRFAGEGASLARVRLIVPSGQGQPDAAGNIYACFYDITYQRGR